MNIHKAVNVSHIQTDKCDVMTSYSSISKMLMKTAPTLWFFAWNIREINSPLAIFYSPQIDWKAWIYLCEFYRNIWFPVISMWLEPCFTTAGLFFYFYVLSAFFLYPPPNPLTGMSLYSSLAPVPIATNAIANGQQFKYRLPHIWSIWVWP